MLTLDAMGTGAASLDGPWQFHIGDDTHWADPAFDDSRWEQLTADSPWGAQEHRGYTGFAWYRRHLTISSAPGTSPDIALLVPAIDDVYEIYWNGQRAGLLGSMPPRLVAYEGMAPQAYGLGPIRSGVLAVRVFKLPLGSNEDGISGGFQAVPIAGRPEAIGAIKGNLDFHWLRSQQFRFGLSSLYGLIFVLSLIAWWRDRSQRLLFWMAAYALPLLVETPLLWLRLQYPFAIQDFLRQTLVAVREISLWFLLLWLLRLDEVPRVARVLRVAAFVIITTCVIDGLLNFLFPSVIDARGFVIADAILTCLYLPPQIAPVILAVIALARRRRLDSARWIVAALAFLNSLFYAVVNYSSQGNRFTHWTLDKSLMSPLFTIAGNAIGASLILRTLLFLSIVYAVIRYSIENSRHQSALEQEFQNARELQQVLIPEHLPSIPGFTLTSTYKPAHEVGGDFFQIIPLEKGSTLVVLGDVSGKGLKAAMAVSLIVGVIRTLAETTAIPADILAGLNRRLHGRLQGGFATAIALRLDPDGFCTLAIAGHPAPFLNDQELELPGALPLGIAPSIRYEESTIRLGAGDRLALYTDGLLEARSQTGDLYGFDRLKSLFAGEPTAAQATEVGVAFGQEDDITVLTLTRLAAGQEATAAFTSPVYTPA
jgi:hypothetical protein